MDFTDHAEVIKGRTSAHELERDSRDKYRECITAFTKSDGFWEDGITSKFSDYDRPRYSFPVAKSKIMKAWGELAEQDIQVNIRPSDGAANKDTAKTMAGLYRAIEYQSNAKDIYSTMARRFMVSGFDALMLEQDYADQDTMNQELFIRAIPDAVNRVWFFGNWSSPVGEDADAVTIDQTITKEEFEGLYSDLSRKCSSLQVDSESNVFWRRREGDVISRLFYKQTVTKTIYELPDGNIGSQDDVDLLKEMGVNVSKLRKRSRKTYKIMARYYDQKGWLNESEETVFDLLPVVAALPNFEIFENKPVSFGMLEDMLDAQRVHNYTASKLVGDTALAPKPKIWLHKEHAAGYTDKLKTYNNNNDPVFIYNNVPNAQPPFQMGASGVDPSLYQLMDLTAGAMDSASGLFGMSEGKQYARQSAEAIDLIQAKGDVGSREYFNTLRRVAEQIAKISVRAMPRVYDTPMIKRIISESGEYEVAELNQQQNDENGEYILNDITSGIYDVYCDVGASYRSRRAETADKLEAMAAIDPSIITQNKDIFLGSIDSPGMDKAAARARLQLVNSGQIPDDQLTDEEKQQVQARAAQPQPQDPMVQMAEAETKKAEALQQKAVTEQQTEVIKLQQAQQKMEFEQAMQKIQLSDAKSQQALDQQSQIVDMLNKMADTLNKLKEATGAQQIVSPMAAQAYGEIAQDMTELESQV